MDFLTLEDGTDRLPQKSVSNYHSMQHNIPEEPRSNETGNYSLFLIFVVPCIMLYSGEISPKRCNNCVFYSQLALLYMFQVTISPIIRSTMLYMATGELAHLGCY